MSAKEHPILFSAPMVRALLDDTKTQTRRRAIKTSQPDRVVLSDYDKAEFKIEIENLNCGLRYWQVCPCGQPGDRLWVRETFSEFDTNHGKVVWYRAESDDPDYWHGVTWKPSIFMPRRLSRITLEITGVRVERLQDISEADALAEGVDMDKTITMPFSNAILWASVTLKPRSAQQAYAHLWESINGPGSWAVNPWAWVIEFKRVTA